MLPYTLRKKDKKMVQNEDILLSFSTQLETTIVYLFYLKTNSRYILNSVYNEFSK
jgi:hypothetical protein